MSNGITTSKYKRGGYIVMEGEKSTGTFFIIQDGQVRLSRAMAVEEISRVDVGPGDFFEVESAFTERRRLMTAVARTDCTILTIHKNMFDTLIQKRPSLVQKIILSFSQRMRKLDHVLANINVSEEVPFSDEVFLSMGKYYQEMDMLQPALLCLHNYIKNNPQSHGITEAKTTYEELLHQCNNNPAITATLEEDLQKTTAHYKKDQMIFCEGMAGNSMYFIQSGSVNITKYVNDSEIVLAVLSSGNLFGEMALLESKPRSANAVTASDSSLLVITNENFPIIVKKQPFLITRITTVLAERIWFIYRQIGNVVLPEGQERLYDVLQIFMERQGLDDNIERKSVTLNINHKDLIKHTAMSTRIANATLKDFVRDHVLTLAEDKVIINNAQYVNNRANYFRMTYERKKQTESKTSPSL